MKCQTHHSTSLTSSYYHLVNPRVLRTEYVERSAHKELNAFIPEPYKCEKKKVSPEIKLSDCSTYDVHYDELLEHFPIKIWNEGQYLTYVEKVLDSSSVSGEYVVESRTATDIYYSPLDMTRVFTEAKTTIKTSRSRGEKVECRVREVFSITGHSWNLDVARREALTQREIVWEKVQEVLGGKWIELGDSGREFVKDEL